MAGKIVSLEEYRKRLVKTFVTRNGLNVKVKVLTSTIPFLKTVKRLGLEKPETLDLVELAEKTENLYHELFKEYLLEPKIDVDLKFEEMLEEDKIEIFQAIVGELTFFRLPAKPDSIQSTLDSWSFG